MEFHILHQLFYSIIACTVSLLLFIYCLLRWKKNKFTQKHPPEPSGSWPVIGHLHLLGDLPHISLGKMADKYGDIFMIKLGVKRAVVISSHKMARECLGINDKVFVDRPQTIFVEHMAYNSAMLGFARYGQYWRDMRKIINVELLSNQRVEMFKHVRISELKSAIKDTYAAYCVGRNTETVDMKNWINDISLNSTVRLISGKSLKETYQVERYVKVSKSIRDFFELAGVFVLADSLPFLRWLDFGGHEKSMKKVAREMDQVVQEWLEKHKRKRFSKDGEEKQDFMDLMLGLFEMEQYKPTEFEADTIIKATCMTVLVAATDTTAVTLIWALSLLLNNKDAMKKAQAETDAIVGKERQVNESDLKDLLYLEAVLKETMRLYPAGPLSVPREAVEDCTVNGYHIRTGTQLFVNLYKIQRDPEVWPNPSEFIPERFLTTHKNYDFRGTNFGFTPFGAGKRICPGITLAFKSMMFTLATLLHGFEFLTPLDDTVDMTEGFGLTNMKSTPLNVILVPRLPENLYNLTEAPAVVS